MDCGYEHRECKAPDTQCPHWQGTFCELDMMTRVIDKFDKEVKEHPEIIERVASKYCEQFVNVEAVALGDKAIMRAVISAYIKVLMAVAMKIHLVVRNINVTLPMEDIMDNVELLKAKDAIFRLIVRYCICFLGTHGNYYMSDYFDCAIREVLTFLALIEMKFL